MKIIKDNHGMSYFISSIITIVLVMILSSILFFAQCITLIRTSKSDTERVFDSFIMKNSIDIYQSIKQGHDLIEKYDEDFFISEIISELSLNDERLSLDIEENMLYNYTTEQKLIYAMSKPKVTFKMDKALKLNATYDIHIPVTFANKILFHMTVPISITRSLTLKE